MAKKKPKAKKKAQQPIGKWAGLGSPECLRLAHACMIVEEAFGESCFLVGSALERRDYRDVDLRLIMDDDKFDVLFGAHARNKNTPFLSLLAASISDHLSRMTDLPIDFQIQRRGSIKEADWDKRRDHVLFFVSSEYPEWRKKDKAT